MPSVITTCSKCRAQYAWNSDFQEYPDCPNCGHNAMKIAGVKWDKYLSAAERGDLAAVKQALRDQGVRGYLNAGPLTILHHAVSGNQIDVVKYLLKKGAEPDRTYPKAGNKTPLHIAASKGYHDIAKVLIDSGARVDARDSNGAKPIDKATDDATISFLQPYDNKMTTLKKFFAAVEGGETAKVEGFLRQGIDPNQKDPSENKFGNVSGIPPLNYAAGDKTHGYQMAKILIRYGADVNIRRNGGISALHDAVLNDHRDIVELLIEKGADINARDDHGETPIQMVLRGAGNISRGSGDYFSLLKVLLDAGAKIRNKDIRLTWGTDTKALLKSHRKSNKKWWQLFATRHSGAASAEGAKQSAMSPQVSEWVHIACPQCGKQLRISGKYAGKTGKCKKCGGRIEVPLDFSEDE